MHIANYVCITFEQNKDILILNIVSVYNYLSHGFKVVCHMVHKLSAILVVVDVVA